MGLIDVLRGLMSGMNPSEVTAVQQTGSALIACSYALYTKKMKEEDWKNCIEKYNSLLQEKKYEEIRDNYLQDVKNLPDEKLVLMYGEYTDKVIDDGYQFAGFNGVTVAAASGKNGEPVDSVIIAFAKDENGTIQIVFAKVYFENSSIEYSKSFPIKKLYAVGTYFRAYEDSHTYDSPNDVPNAPKVDNFFYPLKRKYASKWWYEYTSQGLARGKKKKTAKSSTPSHTAPTPKGSTMSLLDVKAAEFFQIINKDISDENLQEYVYGIAALMKSQEEPDVKKEKIYLMLQGYPSTTEKDLLEGIKSTYSAEYEDITTKPYVAFNSLLNFVKDKKEIKLHTPKTDVFIHVPNPAKYNYTALFTVWITDKNGNHYAIYAAFVNSEELKNSNKVDVTTMTEWGDVNQADLVYVDALLYNPAQWIKPAPVKEEKEEEKEEKKKGKGKKKEEEEQEKKKIAFTSLLPVILKDSTFEDRHYISEEHAARFGLEIRSGESSITAERLRTLFKILLNNFGFVNPEDAMMYLASWLTKDARVLLKGVPATGKTTLIESSVLLFANPFDKSAYEKADEIGSYKRVYDALTGKIIGIAVYNLEKTATEILYYSTIDMKERELTKIAKNPQEWTVWEEGKLTKWVRYEFTPKPREIVSCPIHFHNEANRMNRDVQDAVLALMEEKRVEYMGKVINAPKYNLHFFDYNPHLEPKYPLDWAFLDRINIGIYMPQLDLGSQFEIMKGMSSGVTKKIQDKIFADIAKAVKKGIYPLSFTELVALQIVIDKKVELTDEEYLIIQTLLAFFTLSPHVYSDWYLDYKGKTEYLDLSMNAYGKLAMEGGGSSLDTGSQTAWHILEQTYRPIGFRAYRSAVSYYKTLKFIYSEVFGISKKPEEIAAMMLPYLVEHRISQAVGEDIKRNFLNYADVIKHYLLAEGGYIHDNMSLWIKKYIPAFVKVKNSLGKYKSENEAEHAFLKELGYDDASAAYATDPILYLFGKSIRNLWRREMSIKVS